MDKPDFVINTEKIYKSFSEEIDNLRKVGVLESKKPRVDEIVISAYVKCYDFMIYLCNLHRAEDAFFQIPFLRGICEDLISISYLLQLSEQERNSIILCKQIREFSGALKSQEEYFKKYNPVQPIVRKEAVADLSKYIEAYKEEGINITESYLPSVQKMSKKVGLEDLYSFLYHATSKTVHFDIVTLISMGLGEIDKENDTISPVYSFENNYHHYYKFVFFYTSVLFINQTRRFSDFVDKEMKIKELLRPLYEGYELIDWPTIITFEQMNLPRPKKTSYIARRTVRSLLKKSKEDGK